MLENNTNSAVQSAFRLSALANRAILAVVFFGILLMPIIWFGRPSFAPEQLQENRRPTPFPGYSLFWLQRIEQWFSDRFGMRDALVYYGSRLQMARTGTPLNQHVVIGRDNWLFYDENYAPGRPHFADMQGQAPFSAHELAAIAGNLTRIRQSLQECGIHFYFVMPPDKQTVYREKLWLSSPAGVKTKADQLMEYLRIADPELEAIDLRQVLIDAKATQTYDLYKRTDTHWNTLGAFFGYKEISKYLVRDSVLKDDPRAQLNAYRISRHRFAGGDIAVNLLSLPNYFDDYIVTMDSIQPRNARVAGDMPGWPKGPSPEFVAYNNPTASGTLLLYHDSFSDELIPIFAEDFHRSFAVLRHQIDGRQVRLAAPKVVMLQVVERYLPELTDPPVNLAQICKP